MRILLSATLRVQRALVRPGGPGHLAEGAQYIDKTVDGKALVGRRRSRLGVPSPGRGRDHSEMREGLDGS
ncbi:hypothetical protein HGA02_01335 [Cellulomonas septica]|uniref:Uncharacterized protein n=2 Tax=Cellulomonas septica TaxID=285080 RepID=A0ABX1JW57_9CELL|nr:hypothetical protein [Cellulomonas septica]